MWKTGVGFTARRTVVDTLKCFDCHGALGVAPTFHAGQRNDAPTCSFCHNPNRTSSGWAANANDFIHAIHGGRKRTVDFNWHATAAGSTFGEVEFPSALNDCQSCHVGDSRHCATRKCWSRRIGGCDDLMKPRLLSRGCETRPAKGEPAHAGSQPCDGAGNDTGDA
ncbi:MAG TPA: hypothetical protein VF331_00070 [Polyangiales bacterium]